MPGCSEYMLFILWYSKQKSIIKSTRWEKVDNLEQYKYTLVYYLFWCVHMWIEEFQPYGAREEKEDAARKEEVTAISHEVKILASSVNATESKAFVEAAKNLDMQQTSEELRERYYNPKRKRFASYKNMPKNYEYYSLLQRGLSHVGFPVAVTGTKTADTVTQVLNFQRKYRLRRDKLAGRQVIGTICEVLERSSMKPRTDYPTYSEQVAMRQQQEWETKVPEKLKVINTFKNSPQRLINYLNSSAYVPDWPPKIFYVGTDWKKWLGKTKEKDGIYCHGSAGRTTWDIWQWYSTGLFHYLVLNTGDIVQFVPDTKWHGALWWSPVWKPWGNPKGISVEFSCPPITKTLKTKKGNLRIHETMEPNIRQIEAGWYLFADIEKRHGRRMDIGTSGDGYPESKTKHTDTLTRSKETLKRLGVCEQSITARDNLWRTRFGVDDPSAAVFW